MARIGNLTANLVAETSSFRTDLEKARKQLGGFQRTTNRALGKAEKSFRDFGKSVKRQLKSVVSLRGAIVTLAGGGGLGLLVKRSLSAADSIDKVAQTANVGTTALQELRFAFEQSGVQQQKFDDSLRRFNRRLGEAQRGSQTYRDALTELGVAVNQGTQPALEQTIQALGNVEDASKRASLAARMFGEDAGPQLAGALANGSGAINKLRQDARDLGVIMEEDTINDAVRAKDSMEALGNVISTQLNVAVGNLAPALNNLFKGIIDQLPGVISDIELFAKRLGVISEVSDRTKLRELRKEAAELRRELELSSKGIIQGAGRALNNMGRSAGDVAKELGKVNRQIGIMTGDLDPLSRLNTAGDLGGGGGGGLGSGGGFGGGGSGGGGGNVPRPGNRPDTPSGVGVGFFTGRSERFTFHDALKETVKLHDQATKSIREEALAYAEAEKQTRKVADAHEEVRRVAGQLADRTLDRVGGALTEAFTKGEDAAISFKSVARGVLSEVMQMFVRLAAINPLKNALGIGGGNNATIGSAINALGSIDIGNIFSGFGGGGALASVGGVGGAVPMGRASGGPVSSGNVYRVGEQGPETFVPKMDGMVIPNGGFKSGGLVVNQTINVSANGDKQVAQVARQAAAEGIQQAAPQIVQQSVQQTGERMRRNPKFGRRGNG